VPARSVVIGAIVLVLVLAAVVYRFARTRGRPPLQQQLDLLAHAAQELMQASQRPPPAGEPVGLAARPTTLRVFVSSTTLDLRRHRALVRETLNRMDLVAVSMDTFNARPTGDPAVVSVTEVARCDAYIGIVAWRYGYIPPGLTEAVTHLEYLEARRLHKPCFIFLADPATRAADGPHDVFPAATRDPDNSERLASFRAALETEHVRDYFTTADNLAAKVGPALYGWLTSSGNLPRGTALTPTDYNGLPLPPIAARGLIGREQELSWLTDRLRRGTAGVWAVSGMGGIGKTALVAVCVTEVKDRFPGGVAVVRVPDIVDPVHVLHALVQRFIPFADRLIASPGPPAHLHDELRRALTQKQADRQCVLVVLDNVEPDLARAPGFKTILDLLQTTGVAVVLTARDQLPAGLLVEESLPLDMLTVAQATELFARLCGRFRDGVPTPAEHDAIEQICTAVQGHALATVLAASELQQHPGLTLDAYRKRLGQPFGVLDIVGFTGPVSHVLASSYDQLDEPSRRLFTALGVLADRGCTLAAAAALGMGVDESEQEARDHLDRLAVASLVVVTPDRERIELHPLVQQFVRRLFERTLPAVEADRIRERMARHYARWVPGQPTATLRPDENNLLTALQWATDKAPRSDAILAGLAFGLRWYWDDRFEYDPAFTWLPPGYRATSRVVRRRALRSLLWRRHRDGIDWRRRQSSLAFALGMQYQVGGRLDDASRWFRKSHVAARRARSPLSLAEATSGLAAIAQQRGISDRARSLYRRSLELFEAAGDHRGRADALYRLGFLALRVGDVVEATDYFQRSLAQLREGPEEERLRSVNNYSLGNIHHQCGELAAARRKYEEGLLVCERADLPRGIGAIRKALGDLAWQTGDVDEALTQLEASRDVFRRIFDRQAEGVALYSYAFVLRQVGRVEEATANYRESLAIRLAVDDQRGAAFVRKGIGDLARRTAGQAADPDSPDAVRSAVRTDMREAGAFLTRGLELSRRVGDRRNVAVALKALGDLAWQSGDRAAAGRYYAESLPLREQIRDLHGQAITRKACADLDLAEDRLDTARGRLAAAEETFVRLADPRGQAAVLHSRAVLAVREGDPIAAANLLTRSLDLFATVRDVQSQAVVTLTSACLAELSDDRERAERLYRDGLVLATASRAVPVRAQLAEGLGAGYSDGTERRRLLEFAAAVYDGLGRPQDAARVRDWLAGRAGDRPADRATEILIYDLDEGPNGQGFAIPNDRRRTSE
jgi:tetratricopeptide (TPR) repeat protein